MKWNENSRTRLIARGVRVTFGVRGEPAQISPDQSWPEWWCRFPITSCFRRAEGPIATVFSVDFFFFLRDFHHPDDEATLKRRWNECRRFVPSWPVLHVRGASEPLTTKKKPEEKKQNKNNIPTFVEGTKKNHFVSLTFVACFYFLIVGVFFFFCFMKREEIACLSFLMQEKP